MTLSTSKSTTDTKHSDQQAEQSLYEKHEKIYPREVHGIFAKMRALGVFSLLGAYYVTPFLRWDGEQAVLLDLPARQFHIFGLTLWPQDFIYLAALLMISAFALFFFTALAGRLWCGYACPQTVWTEAFLWIERKVEGNRAQQIKLAKMPWNFKKFRLRFTKHFLWLAFSLLTGFVFVGYFSPIDGLAQDFVDWTLGPWETFWIFFYGFATYGNAGWMREQVCKYMCPYARFQSAMFDDDTLIVAYDDKRGDPRGRRKKSADYVADGLGSCVDCGICVAVCPTGIDIRDGLQYECISCSACIDACNDVMDKMGYEPNLIRYTTLNKDEGKESKLVRPRIVIYAGILIALTLATGYSLTQRISLGLDVIRDRNQLYRETSEGLIENVYTLKLINMDNEGHNFTVSVDGINNMTMNIDKNKIYVESGEVFELPLQLQVEEDELKARSTEIQFTLQATDDESLKAVEEARFLGPN